MQPLISVIIPTFRRAEFLTRAVDSVLHQSYENYEVLVVDDNGEGSPHRENVQALLSSHYQDNPRVRLLQNARNMGGAKSRNFGASQAKGDYLCFLDDDDVYLPDKLRDQVSFMRENDLELSFTDIKMLNEKDVVVDFRDHSRYITATDNKTLLKLHLMHHLTPTDCYMFSRAGFEKTGGFQTRKVSQEFMLMLESIEKGLRIGYLKGVYAIQYIHSQGRISQDSKRVSGDRELLRVKEQYFDRLDKKEIQYIRFRFYAALAVYFLRNKHFGSFFTHGIKALITSPSSFFREGSAMLRRVRGGQNGGI